MHMILPIVIRIPIFDIQGLIKRPPLDTRFKGIPFETRFIKGYIL